MSNDPQSTERVPASRSPLAASEDRTERLPAPEGEATVPGASAPDVPATLFLPGDPDAADGSLALADPRAREGTELAQVPSAAETRIVSVTEDDPTARLGSSVSPPGDSATAVLPGDSSIGADSVVSAEKTVPLPEPPATLEGTLVPDFNLWQHSTGGFTPPARQPQPHEETLTTPDEGSVTDGRIGPSTESLTAPETAGGGHFTRAPLAAPAPAAPGRHGGPRVAGYEVLGELGRGGMGVVYKARHMRLNRLVALKVIRAGTTAGRDDVERFQREAEAVAQLHHRNVVQIYEIGEHDGMPFFSLEFVDGGSLDKRIAGKPQPPRDAAEIVRQLAEAMQAAHDNGIIHRDLKPANVLLASGGYEPPGKLPGGSYPPLARAPGGSYPPLAGLAPKITDFGLAKRFEGGSSQTRDGSIMGTPSYMAPEQAAGRTRELGPPTDIYALGAVLYDLLTGHPPFKGETAMDTLQLVLLSEPAPPVRLEPTVPRDLQIICLKCLEKEPAKRYASAAALAEDLRRWLAGEPILARPASLPERVWKWCRRYPTRAALIAVSTAALLTFGVGGLAYARLESRRAEDEKVLRGAAEVARKEAEENFVAAEKARQREEQQKRQAEENFAEARRAVHQLTLISQRRLVHEPHMELVRREMLQTALGFNQRFLARHSNRPELGFQVNLARLRLGDIEAQLGNLEAAETAYREAIAALDALPAKERHPRDYRLALATAWNDLALLLQVRQHPRHALEAIGRAVDLRQDLEKDFPKDREVRAALAQACSNHGDMLQVGRKFAEAERAYGQARERFEALTKRFPLELTGKPRKGLPRDEEQERLGYARDLSRTHANLATLWTGRDAKKAGQAYEQAVTIVRALAGHYPELPYLRQELARILLNRGALRHVSGQANEAHADYQEATRLLARLAAEFRSVPDYRRLLSNVYFNHGQLLRAANEPRQAEKVWRLLLPVAEALTEEFPSEVFLRERLGRTHNELGIALTQHNQGGPAEKAFRDAVAVLEPLVAKPPPQAGLPSSAWEALAESHANLTSVVIALGPAKEAEARAEASVAASQRWAKAFPNLALSHDSLAQARITLADFLIAQRRKPAEGVAFLEQAAVSLARCLPLAERAQDREAYATRALKALERAAEHGYRDVNRLRTLPEFEPLRGRADFRKLLARLEKSGSISR